MSNFISSLIGEGVVVAWHDFRSGTFADISGGGNDLTDLTSPPEWHGRHLYFDGPGGVTAGNYIDTVSGSQFGPTSGTMMVYARCDNDVNLTSISMCLWDDRGNPQSANNHIRFRVNIPGGTCGVKIEASGSTVYDASSTSTITNRWASTGIAWDSSGAGIYIDGLQETYTGGDKTSTFGSASNMRLRYGAEPWPSDGHCWLGPIACGILINRALTETEMSQLYGGLMS